MADAIPRIELWGGPDARGRRHGQLLGTEIRTMRNALLAYLARISWYAGALPLYGLLMLLARRFLWYLPAHLRREMIAVASGAEMGLLTLLLINVADDLANNSPRCSALAVAGNHTDRGTFLMGRNLDYPVFTKVLAELQTLLVMEPEQGQGLASLAWPGYVGVCTGISQAGVALAQLSSMSRDRTLQGVPAALRFRLALEQEDTVGSVVAHVLKLPGTIGNNLLLCGPQEAVVVELSARRSAVRFPQQGVLSVTNHYQAPAMQDLKGRFPSPPPFTVLSDYHFTEAYSQARNARLRKLAVGTKVGPVDLQNILGDDQIANAGTAVAALFSPAERLMWVATGQEPPVSRGPWVKISLWR